MASTVASLASSELRELYEQRLAISHICEFNLHTATPDQDAAHVRSKMEQRDFDIVPILVNGSIESFAMTAELGNGAVGDYAHPITLDHVIADSTSLLAGLALFQNRDWFFVLRSNKVAGVVHVSDLRKPPVQMFLFALVSLLEGKLIRMINHYRPGDAWQELISESRLEKARDLLEERQRRGSALDLIDCLQLADKATIAARTPEMLAALGMNRAEAKEFFKRARELRDDLAHAQDLLLNRTWSEVLDLIKKIDAVLLAFDGTLVLDFSSVPSDSALALAQNESTSKLATLLAHALDLDSVERNLLNAELIGVVAQLIDTHLEPQSS